MPSEHPSRSSFEDARAYTMEHGQLDHRKARSAVRSYASLGEHFGYFLNRHCFAPITAA